MEKEQEKSIEKQIKELLSDQEFEMLNLSLKEPNIFHILEDTKKELKHSNFLSYLLNPNENHGLYEIFLQGFIREVFSDTVELGIKNSVLDIVDLSYNEVQVLREWKNIDILIVMKSDVFCIENKINITDHNEQLEKYRKIIDSTYPNKRKHYVYLTPFGEPPTQKDEYKYYHCLSYQIVVDLLHSIVSVYKSKLNTSILLYLNDYITTLKRDILMSDELNEKAAKLYAKYADAIEFIYSAKPDVSETLYPFFVKAIEQAGFVICSKNKGYVRFTTHELDVLLPRTGKGWPNKESFAFEFDYFWNSKNCVFRAVISPCDEETKNKIHNLVKDKHYYKKPSGEKWVVFNIESDSFNAEKMMNEEDDTIMKNVGNIVNKYADRCKEIAKDIEIGYKQVCDSFRN